MINKLCFSSIIIFQHQTLDKIIMILYLINGFIFICVQIDVVVLFFLDFCFQMVE